MHGSDTSPAALRQAAEVAATEAQVMTDGQGSAAYKRELVRVYVMLALSAALNRLASSVPEPRAPFHIGHCARALTGMSTIPRQKAMRRISSHCWSFVLFIRAFLVEAACVVKLRWVGRLY